MRRNKNHQLDGLLQIETLKGRQAFSVIPKATGGPDTIV